MNLFNVRVDFDFLGSFSDFSFDKIEEASAFLGAAADLGLKATLSRSSMSDLDSSLFALKAMHTAIAKLKTEMGK